MNPVVFEQSLSVDTLYLELQAEGPRVTGWRSFLHPDTDENLPETFTLKETWLISQGVYLFAPYEPESHKVYVDKVKAFINNMGELSGLKSMIMWLMSPDAEIFTEENVKFIEINTSPTGVLVTEKAVNILFSYIGLYISKDCIVHFDDNAQHIRIHRGAEYTKILFSGTPSQRDTEVVNGEIFLPFGGPGSGTIRFLMNAHQRDFYLNFKVGMKYFYKNPDDDSISGIDYPIFEPSNKDMTFQVGLDPVDQWNRNKKLRTYLAFEKYSLSLTSYYRTQFGHQIHLFPRYEYTALDPLRPYQHPTPRCGMFVFSVKGYAENKPIFPMYMLPSGDFYVHVPDAKLSANDTVKIICGLSGTETISCLSWTSHVKKGDVMSFSTGHPAYAPMYRDWNGYRKAAMQTSLLTKEYITAWCAITNVEERLPDPSIDIIYRSQPEDESWFRPSDSSMLLDSYEPTVCTLTNKQVFVPLVSHSGSSVEGRFDESIFESQVISTIRREEIIKVKNQHNNLHMSESLKATTPKGLLLTLIDGNWNELILAKSVLGEELKFMSVSQYFQNALLAAEQFIVISQNASNVLGSFYNSISIAGWPFSINIPIERDLREPFKNILIFKFCQGTLVERVTNPKLWTDPKYFNHEKDLETLPEWLTSYCEDAKIKLANGDKDYKNFVEIVNNPQWNGILALQVDLSSDKFPEGLAFLLGGIDDINKLKAHHFGVNVNRVRSDSNPHNLGDLQVEASSLFGLLDYKSSGSVCTGGTRPPVDAYRFNVCELRAGFHNSRLVSFNSKFIFTLRKLFDCYTVNGDTGVETEYDILFRGTYEDHDGIPYYSFNADNVVHVTLNNQVLKEAILTKVDFRTMTAQADSERVRARFSFFGKLKFAEFCSGNDIFSFDELDISNLGIEIEFRKVKPREHQFYFDPGNIGTDIRQSKLRDKSLLDGFPLQMKGFISGKTRQDFINEGYMSIPLQNSSDSEEDDESWYGLDFSVDLGSMGDLSSNNNMTSSFVLLWSSRTSQKFCGMKIPSISGQSMFFKLQEIIDTRFEHLKLAYENGVFMLRMTGLSQLFLGQSLSGGSGDKCSSPSLDTRDSITLFRDPNSKASSIGWYASYQQDGGNEIGRR